jgi:hypothetical protein
VSGCASGGSRVSTSPALPAAVDRSDAKLLPLSIPLVNDAAIESSLSSVKSTQNSIGQVPSLVPILIGVIDAPLFNLSQVNLALERVNAISNLATSQQTETALSVYPGEAVVNVLDYQDTAANLGISFIPSGEYDALEFVVDPANSNVVTTSGQKLPLVFGTFTNHSFSQSTSNHYSIVAPYNFDATIGINNLLFDVNIENSLNVGSKGAAFGASTFAANGLDAGAIGGTVVTSSGAPVQNATAVVTSSNGTLMGLAPTDSSGTFMVHALNAGTYNVTIYGKYLTAADMTVVASDGWTGSISLGQVNVPALFEAYVGTIRD